MKAGGLSKSRIWLEVVAGSFSFGLIFLNCCLFASLIFKGPLSSYLSLGLTLFLAATLAMQILIGLRTSFSTLIVGPQEAPTIMLASVGSALVVSAGSQASPESLVASVLVLFVIVGLATGVFFIVLGRFKIGYIMDYLPFPVVCAFFAGVGFLLIRNALGMATEGQVGNSGLSMFLEPRFWESLVWPIGTAVVLVVVPNLLKRAYWFPLLTVLAIGIFYAYLGIRGLSIEQAQSAGWLFGSFTNQPASIQPASFLAAINWSLVFNNLGHALVVVIIATSNLLLNVSGLALQFDQEIDANRELRVAGLSNLVSGLLGVVGYHYFSTSIVNHRFGSRTKGSTIVILVLTVVVLVLGGQIVTMLPKPILVGILLAIGWRFLVEWLWTVRRRTSRLEFVLVWIIFGIVVSFGILPGVIFGIMAAAVIFVFQYGQISIVKHELSLATTKSNVEHPPAVRDLLARNGERAYILSLQNYIFFGTSFNLLEQIRQRLADATRPRVRYVVLDFRLVRGVDASFIWRLGQLRQILQKIPAELVLCDVAPPILQKLTAGGDLEQPVFPSIGAGLAWVEEAIITEAAGSASVEPIIGQLTRVFGGSDQAEKFFHYLTKREFPSGAVVYRRGEPGTDLYIVESGQLGVLIQAGAKDLRLSTIKAGTMVGELAFFNRFSRTATVVADLDSTLFQLNYTEWEKLKRAQPELAGRFYDFTIHLLSTRLITGNREIQALLS